MDIARHIGRRLAELRERASLTQQEVAEKLGWQPQTYARIEQGAKNVTLGTLDKILVALGANHRALFVPLDDPGRASRPGRPKRNAS